MRLDRISYKKIFPIGSYINETIGVEFQIDETDDWEETFVFAKEMVEKLHKENNKGLYIETISEVTHANGTPPPSSSIPTIDPRACETAEIGIDNATTIQDLEFYADIAVKYGLVEMYLNKKAVLSK